jgi:type I restriction enzyme S subunit
MSFPRYPKYKASGVEWLGDVPEHWVVCAPKRRIKSSAGGTLIKGTCADEPSDGLFPGFSASGQNIWLEEYAYDCPAIVLSAVGARCGKAFKADGQWGVVANTHCLFPRPDSDRDYLWYLTNQEDWWEKGGSAQPFVKVSETLARPWVFPPLPEQTAIAEFLDRETGNIDELVAEQRRLIELLKEKRQAVISHAVTKGLNPHALMKPSGIEWLGEVPEHWEVKRLRFVANLNPSKSEISDLEKDTVVSFLPMEAVGDDGTLTLDKEKTIAELETGYTYFRDGDVTIAKITPCYENGKGALMGGLTNGIGFGTTELIVARPMPSQTTGNYLHYLFISQEFRDLGESHMYGAGGQKRVPDDFVRNFATSIPPLPEQIAIVDFLETELAKFDTLTAEAQRAIDLLQERRTALISAAVTGQIDVRETVV